MSIHLGNPDQTLSLMIILSRYISKPGGKGASVDKKRNELTSLAVKWFDEIPLEL